MITTLTSLAAGQSALSALASPYHSGGCGFCTKLQQHRYILEAVGLAFERQLIGGQALHQQLKRLVIDLLGLREIEAVKACLEWRHATSNPELKAPVAHLVEHADFFDQ